jgi:glycosyltransferase involved in cell wall biosynthesis
MKILYLYSEVMGYNLPIFAELVKQRNADVHVVHWDQNKLTPFSPAPIAGVKFYKRSSYSETELLQFAQILKPDLVYVSGWMDRGYLQLCAALKASGVIVVVGFDSQWTGSLRQYLGAALMKLHHRKKYFSYALVPGPLQEDYARRIGFADQEIIPHLLSGDTANFSKAAKALDQSKQAAYPENFLYVGRFAEMKGLDILLEAYAIYKTKYQGRWTLTCIGNGALRHLLTSQPDITAFDFLPQAELIKHACEAGAFILPSRFDPWGVVVHEFAAAGLPLILSDKVGANQQFLSAGQNGYLVKSGSAEALAQAMYTISTKSVAQLIRMGERSAELAEALTPAVAASSFLSAFDRKDGPAWERS